MIPLAEVDDGSCLYNDICGVCGGSIPDEFYEYDVNVHVYK